MTRSYYQESESSEWITFISEDGSGLVSRNSQEIHSFLGNGGEITTIVPPPAPSETE